MRRNSTALSGIGALLCGGLVVAAVPAYAAELVTAELVGIENVVEVEQGKSADFTITLSAIEKAACGATSTGKVKNAFSLSSTGAVGTGTTFSDPVGFTASGAGNGTNCDLVRTGDGVRSARVSAAPTTTLGDYKISLSEKSGTTVVTNSNTKGGTLKDDTATTLKFRVVMPVVVNQAPASGNAPGNASGNEGSTLQTSGSFTDADGDLVSIAVTSGAGTVTADKNTSGALTGSWSWTLPTTDNVNGSVTVTATDSHGATATQSFSYAAANVAPRIAAEASDAPGLEGGTLTTGGAFTDVSGDVPLAITKLSGEGEVVANADGTWSWSLVTTNETSGTVQVQADDGDLGVTVDTFTFTAANVAPGVRADAGDVFGDEGSPLGNAGAFSDVPADTLTVSHEGDGTLIQTSADGAWSWSVDGADNGTGTVSVTATDGTATSTPDTFTYTVRNVAPKLAVEASNASGNEGTKLTTSGHFSDVATDPLTITKVSGPGTVTGKTDGTWSWSFDSTDDLIDQVVVQADDGDGGTTTDTFDVKVLNLAPTVFVSAQPATGSEGNTLATRGSFTDVPADTITITSTGGGTLVDNGNGAWSWSLATTDQTSGTVIVTATDDDLGTVTDTFTYEAINVAPQVTVAAADQSGVEGDTLTASGSFQDVAADNITVSRTSGPGTVTDLGGGNWSYTLPTTDQITATVVVTATDKDGASNTDEFTVTAVNVAPAVGLAPANSTGSEGDTLSTSGSFTDVPADPITITKTGAGTLTDNGDGTWSWSLATTDDASGAVTVTANDGDGGTTGSTFTYAAKNVAPTLSALSVTGITGAACTTGNAVGLKFTVSDPGSADTMTGTINWGDGSSEAFTSRSVDTTHAYAAGSYTITVNVADDDGGVAVPQSAPVVLNYAVGAIQAPFNPDGTSVFKYGSTVPVKVRITDCLGAPVAGLAPTIRVALASSTAPTTAINETVESTSSADTTGVLRYDATAGQYIYNMATKSLSDGDAKYVVTVANGGAQVTQKFGLRTK